MPLYPYIAFEGPIAAGKTTHATLFAQKANSMLLLENFPDNEFLADFYADKERWALPMQLSFLSLRHKQLSSVTTPLTEPVVADYSYLKDDIFAQLLLRGRELRLYQTISSAFKVNVTPNDLIVFLDADNDVLLRRIRERNRPYEATIDAGYLDGLREAYEESLSCLEGSTVVRYSTSNLNLSTQADVDRLHQTIVDAITRC